MNMEDICETGPPVCSTYPRLAILFLGTKLGILGHQFYAHIWTKIRSKLHARENARATLQIRKF